MASEISAFFNSKSVFITGATGFVGKQVIEKLLRSCSGIDRIYILVRSKRGIHINERIEQLCSLPLFDKVRLIMPDFKLKIIPILGDITKSNLDLNIEDEQILINNCHIVINSGASIRFTDPLKESIKSNVYSVQNMINLCKKMKQLQSFVHISTAYIHPYRTDINEVVYPTNENPKLLLESLDYFDEKIFDHLSEKVLKQYPNSYTYTKSLGEYLLFQQKENLPVAIIRPSIIGSAWNEPIPGWIDSYGGPTSIIISVGKCLLRTGSGKSIVDFPMIPVDTVANMTIAIAWFTATNKNSLSTPTVYNCCTGSNNKTAISLGNFFRTMITEVKAIGFEDYSIIEPSMALTMNRSSRYCRRLMEETIPAYIIDMIAYLTFRKARAVRISEKVHNLRNTMEYFCQHQWIFTNQSSQYLRNHMNNIDREEFNFDLTGLNWTTYIRNYCIGIKKYLLKENLPSTPKRSFVKSKDIRRFISILSFFIVTWFTRQVFLKRLRMIWNILNLFLRSFLQRDQKKIFYSLK